VVSFGYNTVWRDEYTVESQIGGNTLQDLRRFQIQKELEDLDLLAELIATKTRRTPDQQLWPRWLVVAVNKADLYWDDIDTAAQYYLPGSGSPFDRKREKIVSHFGGLYPFVSETIPVALSTTDFTFTAREMDVTAESQLHPDQISAAVNFMRMRLEGLSGI
jgi:hypothetical protein